MSRPRKIVVSAYCQTAGLGSALQVLFPTTSIRLAPIPSQVKPRRLKRLLSESSAWVHCDVGEVDQWARAADEMPHLRHLRVPLLEFRAFHPDMCSAYDRRSNENARQKYSSRIGVWAYHKRMSPAAAARYFDEAVFERLGYLDCWDECVRSLQEGFRASDLGGHFGTFYHRIKRLGQFMHTATHPISSVLTALAKLSAIELGSPESVFERQLLVDDALAYLRWPVYPEIAQRLSIPTTGYVWKMSQSTLDEDLVIEGVEEFLSYCFRHYERQGITPENIAIRGVDLVELDRQIARAEGAG